MEDLETQLIFAETSYDELVKASVKLANLVAEHSETDYSHDDSPFELKELGYLDSEVAARLTSSVDLSYFNCSSGPDLIEHTWTLLSNTEEALNHISPPTSPKEYYSRELIHRHQNLYHALGKIQEFLEDSEINQNAMEIVESNSERYPEQNYSRVEFEIPENIQSATSQQNENKESAN